MAESRPGMTDTLTARPGAKVRRSTLVDLLRENVIWIILAVVVIVMSLASDVFLTPLNILNILRQVSILGIVAIGMTFAMIGGSFDLAVGATMGLATVVLIQLQPVDPASAVVAVICSLLAGLLVGVVNGVLVGWLETNSVVTTIGTLYVVWGITLIYTKARHVWVVDMYPPLAALGTGRLGPFPLPIFAFLITGFLGHLALTATRFGRYLYATGGNSSSARLSGINVGRVRLISYMLSGLAAAIAGIVIAARVKNVDPSFGVGFEFDVLAAVILGGTSLFGGRGSVLGTVAGVLLLGVLGNAMTLMGISYQYQLMIRGIILVVAVAVNVIVRRQRG
jgi:ribose/xylose/arabinose/galactoside ABC-type transport system permease subunit